MPASQPDSYEARAPLSRPIHSQNQKVVASTAKLPLVVENPIPYQHTTRRKTVALS